ncbi:MAG: DUF2127 domain-containing protein, partial [Chloroflexota bacterium]|nr:DUF2127 domain-containing protein [Chloroflexota bacterium]
MSTGAQSRIPAETTPESPPGRQLFGKPLGIGLIIVQKSVAALFFGLLALVLLVLYFKGITHPFQRLFFRELLEDPHDQLASFAISHLPEVSKSALLRLGLGSLLYFLLEAGEAAGLMRDQYWVEIFIVIETGLFLPFEGWEIAQHASWAKVAAL